MDEHIEQQFGVITVNCKENKIVVYEGNSKELFSILDVIKENVSETAEVKLLDEKEYNSCKDNIVELRKILV